MLARRWHPGNVTLLGGASIRIFFFVFVHSVFHMPLTELVGYLAAMLTTLSFLPQVLKIWQTKRAGDISLPAFGALSLGVLLWLIYGLTLGIWPLILANAVTLVLALGVVVLTLRYQRKA